MKKFTFKGVLDGFRSSVQAAPRGTEQEIQETLRSDHFQIKKVSASGGDRGHRARAFQGLQDNDIASDEHGRSLAVRRARGGGLLRSSEFTACISMYL